MSRHKPLKQKFWEKVERGAESDCWNWNGSTNKEGYGTFHTNGPTRKLARAHRFSYEIHNEPPGEQCVLHHCDNTLCVNPDHLYLGDRTQNALDRAERGRNSPGETNGMARLTEDIVREIRQFHESNKVTYQKLADRFGISVTLAFNIVKGHRWGHVQ